MIFPCKFKVGDRVRVVTEGVHFFSVGAIVMVTDVGGPSRRRGRRGGYHITMFGYIGKHPYPHNGEQTGYSWQVEMACSLREYAVKWGKRKSKAKVKRGEGTRWKRTRKLR